MLEFELRGGLGDGFIELHETMAYEETEALGYRDHATVYAICHNPYLSEIFRWHPNADRIRVVASPTFFPDYTNTEKRRLSGLPEKSPDRRPARPASPIRFYPSPEDVRILRCIPDKPFLAIAASASTCDRNIPDAALRVAVATCEKRGIPIVTLGRTYKSALGNKIEPAISGRDVYDLVDCLSVPGTAEVLKRCRAILTCHSALLLLSWYERLPNFTLYTKYHYEKEFAVRSPFSFGKNFPETVHGLIDTFKPERLTGFIEKNFR